MPWTFSQSTGWLSHDGNRVYRGYSGHGPGKNNPAMASMRGSGPTPMGRYAVGAPHFSQHTGSYTMNLDPLQGTNTFGRTLFRIHGDNPQHPGQSSDGCVVLSLGIRQRVWNSGDHVLEVVP